MNQPILIAGAGPVGLAMALALKRQGVRIRIIDRGTQRNDKSKALVIWPRTMEMLDIQRCAESFQDAGIRATGVRIIANGKTLAHLHMDSARSNYRYATMIPQCETERILEEKLDSLGTQVERGVELISFTDADQGITALLRHADGESETARADYLIGCDGAHSTVRHHTGAVFAGDTMPTDWILADIEIQGDYPRDEISICWTAEGVLALFPIAENRVRVIGDHGLATDGDTTPPTVADIQAMVDARGPAGLTVSNPVWTSHFGINERKVKDYRYGHVFLAGDAAHIHSPAGGQGMNTGMQDAFNLAWKLALVWHGTAAPALLGTYSPERSAIAEQVLRSTGNMTKAALVRNPILQELRSLAVTALNRIPALRQRMVEQLSELDLRYRDSMLTRHTPGAAHHPACGERAPDVPVEPAAGTAASRLHDLLSTGKFAVLSVGSAPATLPEELASLATTASATTDTSGYESGHAYLIRPDAYVAMSAAADRVSEIFNFLAQIQDGTLPPS